MIGILGQALGSGCCGWLTQSLEKRKHWSALRAYRYVFFIYAAIGILKLATTTVLSSACEVEKKLRTLDTDSMEQSLLGPDDESRKSKIDRLVGFKVTKESLRALAEVSVLQTLEAISIGLIVTYVQIHPSAEQSVAD